MVKPAILILDCTPKTEPSEGRLLKEFFEICRLYKPAKARPRYRQITSKKQFLQKLDTNRRWDIIHIAAHGDNISGETFIGNRNTWKASAAEIKEAGHRRTGRQATLVFVNACLTSRRDMDGAFNSKYFLAPKKEVEWIDAALFAITFYKKYIIDGKDMRPAWKFARKHTKTGSIYPEYWY